MNRAIVAATPCRRGPFQPGPLVVLSILVAAGSLLTAPLPAAAQPASYPDAASLTPEQEAALDLFEEGKAQFRAGRFEKALLHFEQAYEVYQHPAIGWWKGRTLSRAGRCSEALVLLVAVRGKLGADDEAQKAEQIRSEEEGACRVTLARAHMADFGCRAALDVLGRFDATTARKGDATKAARLAADGEQCAATFDTSGPRGRQAAAQHADAREHLASSRYSEALEAAEASLDLQPTAAARLVRGLALAGLGSCAEALRVLEAASASIGADDALAHAAALESCRHAQARRLVEAEDCRAALPLLESLRGRLKGKEERWRKTSEKWCRPRATEFLTDTSMRRAAYKMFLGARAAAAEEDLALSAKRYRRALKMVDETIIRRELAAVLLLEGVAACPEVTSVLGALAVDVRTMRDAATLLACDAWAPKRPWEGPALVGYVDAVVAVLRAQAAGESAQAITALDHVWDLGGSHTVRAAVLDLLYESERCGKYLAGLSDAIPEVRELVRDAAPREAACRGRAAADQEADAAKAAPAPAPTAEAAPAGGGDADAMVTAEAEAGTTDTGQVVAGWTLVGVGAGALGVGAWFLVEYLDAVDRSTASVATFNDPDTFAWDAGAAWRAGTSAEKTAATSGPVALALGVAGVASAVTGVVLLALSGGGDDEEADADVSIRPVFGPSRLGLSGRF